MSVEHPIVAVTGSSGAGTSSVRAAFEHIFWREKILPVTVQGNSYHRYDRQEMIGEVAKAQAEGRILSHFGPEGNRFEELDELLRGYGERGTGRRRYYLHSREDAERWQQAPGTFTPWEELPTGSDLLLYEGLHGGLVTPTVNIARHVDLLIGVVPIVNLEWIQKIHRDTSERGYSPEAVTDTILRRMHDYLHYITPQFSRTHINFQRIPTVDTSDPFISREVPSADESLVVIRFRDPRHQDFLCLLKKIHDSFMSRPNTIVIPGGKMSFAMEIILMPLVHELVQRSRGARDR